jgi:Rod binding domain-containing protein
MIQSISPQLATDPALRTTTRDPREEFSQILAKASPAHDTPQKRAREASEQLVAHALVLPVLKEFRASNKAAAPFAPNQAERTFRSLMDASLAQHLVTSSNWPLVDRLAQNMLKGMGMGTPPESPTVDRATRPGNPA